MVAPTIGGTMSGCSLQNEARSRLAYRACLMLIARLYYKEHIAQVSVSGPPGRWQLCAI